jgi:hypothetical protein
MVEVYNVWALDDRAAGQHISSKQASRSREALPKTKQTFTVHSTRPMLAAGPRLDPAL